MILLVSYNVKANDLAPVPVQGATPDRIWFYNLEEVVFNSDDSYVPNGYIAYTKWYINGVYQTGGSYHRSMSMCFALPGSPAGDCYQLASGQTTVQIKLEVASNHNYWEEQTITYTIQEHKGRKYFVKDHLGSVRTTVNRDGNVLGYDDYYPFGLTMPGRSSNSANPNDNYKFTGHERDDEAGLTLDYMMARNYDPIIGRFMQIDPYAASYPNLSPYTYVANNPLLYVDPTGMWIQSYDEDGNIRYEAEDGDNFTTFMNQYDLSLDEAWDWFSSNGLSDYLPQNVGPGSAYREGVGDAGIMNIKAGTSFISDTYLKANIDVLTDQQVLDQLSFAFTHANATGENNLNLNNYFSGLGKSTSGVYRNIENGGFLRTREGNIPIIAANVPRNYMNQVSNLYYQNRQQTGSSFFGGSTNEIVEYHHPKGNFIMIYLLMNASSYEKLKNVDSKRWQ